MPKKCPKCGYDIADPAAARCPVCNASLSRSKAGVWLIALFQFGMATLFMLLFRFPKFMIVAFGAMIFIGTLLATTLKARPAIRPAQPKQTTHPILYRVFGILIAMFVLAFLSTLLFGFVMFMNSWDRWHRYQGQIFHESDFVVQEAYYQKLAKGGRDIYARGTVEGTSESMNLRPWLDNLPRNQGELDSEVPVGLSIHVYYFPEMKGRARVQMYTDLPPAEASHREAMRIMNYSLIILALCAGAIFLLVQIQRLICTEQPREQSAFVATASGQM